MFRERGKGETIEPAVIPVEYAGENPEDEDEDDRNPEERQLEDDGSTDLFQFPEGGCELMVDRADFGDAVDRENDAVGSLGDRLRFLADSRVGDFAGEGDDARLHFDGDAFKASDGFVDFFNSFLNRRIGRGIFDLNRGLRGRRCFLSRQRRGAKGNEKEESRQS